VEHEERAERLEKEAERMEQESEHLGERIERTSEDWDSKQTDASVPGAQPDRVEEEEDVAGVETDPEQVSEQGGP
jgi:hypothetical protein